MRVADIMTGEPTVLRGDQQLAQAAKEMELEQIHHLPIIDRHNNLIGVLSDRDLLVAGADQTHPVAEFMSTDLVTIGPEIAAHEAAYLMLRHNISCIPVVDAAGALVGIITETDFVRAAYELLGGKVPIDQIELEEREAERV